MQGAESGFLLDKSSTLPFYSIPAFTASDLVTHGFTTRDGGVSTGSYAALNLGLHVGDDPGKVLENRRRASEALGMELERLVAGQQVHGDQVAVITQEHLGRGGASMDTALAGIDALITNVPGVPLSSYYADCVPLFFLDPANKAVALAHAGWKGTVMGIGAKTVQYMQRYYGSKPQEILVGIGPSVGRCCYQVDRPVMDKLSSSFSYWQQLVTPLKDEKWMLDLWETNRRVLLEAGVEENNITTAAVCTACHSDIFFSYRAASGWTGRMAALIMIK